MDVVAGVRDDDMVTVGFGDYLVLDRKGLGGRVLGEGRPEGLVGRVDEDETGDQFGMRPDD